MGIKRNDLMRTRKHWRNERDHKQHEFFKEKLEKQPTKKEEPIIYFHEKINEDGVPERMMFFETKGMTDDEIKDILKAWETGNINVIGEI